MTVIALAVCFLTAACFDHLCVIWASTSSLSKPSVTESSGFQRDHTFRFSSFRSDAKSVELDCELNSCIVRFSRFCFDGGPLEQVETLVNASPATVSRAGIIFVSDTDLDWSPVVEGWILKRPSAEQAIFKDLFARSEYPRYRPWT